MKYFKLSLVTLAILISGCGGESSNNTPPAQADEAKTITEAEKNLNVLSSLSMKSISPDVVTGSSLKVFNKTISNKVTNQKAVTVSCSNGGTININVSDDEKRFHYSFKSCKNDVSFINGEMTMIQKNSENTELTYDKLTIKNEDGTQYMNLTMKINEESSTQIDTFSIDGIVNQTSKSGEKNNIEFKHFVLKDKNQDKVTSNESWTTQDGTVVVESKCTTGTYTFKTIEKLVNTKDKSDNIESGILKINDATYTFENPYVTIKVGSKEETIKQSELEKHMTNACTI